MLEVLKNTTYRHLFLAQVIALIGTGLITIALALQAYDIAKGEAAQVLGIALAIKMIAYIGVAPIASAFAERLPRKKVLVGLDIIRVSSALESPKIKDMMERLRAELGSVKLILSVERLDYTKGILEKLNAYERLLADNPELIGKVTLVTVCVPAAREMRVYDELQTQIEQAVGRINGRFARIGWTPLQFFFRSLPFEEVSAWYAMADVMWITPLRDGLNLVAKEFVAAQGLLGGRGVLVLSEFAGAAAELKGALLTNPHDPADLAQTCYLALNLPKSEAQARLRELFDIVCFNDIRRWGEDVLAGVAPSEQQPSLTLAS